MIEGLIGKKLGMTQIFSPEGLRLPVTVLEVGPCRVVQIKTKEKDGYEALQLGFGTRKRANQPLKGHLKRAKIGPQQIIREFKGDIGEYKEGQEIKVDLFEQGDLVNVVGTSKGKGFQGVVRRYGFKGGPKSHGSGMHRSPGAIGMCAMPSKVHKGSRLPGQMGNQRVMTKNLKVIRVDPEKNLLVIKGSIPGANKGVVLVKKSMRAGQ